MALCHVAGMCDSVDFLCALIVAMVLDNETIAEELQIFADEQSVVSAKRTKLDSAICGVQRCGPTVNAVKLVVFNADRLVISQSVV